MILDLSDLEAWIGSIYLAPKTVLDLYTNVSVKRLAGSLVKHVTHDLGVMSLSPTLGVESTSKK